jgi:hypothetical protein
MRVSPRKKKKMRINAFQDYSVKPDPESVCKLKFKGDNALLVGEDMIDLEEALDFEAFDEEEECFNVFKANGGNFSEFQKRKNSSDDWDERQYEETIKRWKDLIKDELRRSNPSVNNEVRAKKPKDKIQIKHNGKEFLTLGVVGSIMIFEIHP